MQKIIEHAEIKLRENGMLFTWDDEKAALNYRKHGVRFSEAAAAFFDEYAVIENNSFDNYTGEERFNIIGVVYGDVMFVVYVERIMIDNRDITRIISARRATGEEEKIYADGIR